MKKILSIDFDIIMSPSIEMYNSIADVPWEIRQKESIYYDILTANYKCYNKLTQYLLLLSKYISKEQIHFITDHHQILNYLNDEEKYIIVNIDHHHDRGYGENIHDELTCGNWVNYVPNLERYLWINNSNSFIPEDLPADYVDIMEFDLQYFTAVDELFICFSPLWISPNNQPLFFTWIDIYNRIYNTCFELEKFDKS